MKVRGAVFVARNEDMVIEELEIDPDPGPGEVLVRYGASGLCHSDLSMINGTLPVPPPAVLGHEGAGTIEAVGPGVLALKPGDHVVATFIAHCQTCWHCLRGETQLCEFSGAGGFGGAGKHTRPDGTTIGIGLATFSEAAVISQHSVVKVTTDLPAEQLALIGCGVTTGTGAAINTAGVRPGSTVAVVGCGGVGQAAIQGARIAGASTIIAVDTLQSKLDTAAKLGATHGVLAGEGEDPVGEVKAITGGRGVDFALEVIGSAATLKQAYDMVRRHGAVIAVGVPSGDATLTIPIVDLIMGEKQIRGCIYGSAQVALDMPRLIGYAETGQLDLGAMVSRTIDLTQINEGFRAMKAGEVIRSVISYG
ncbi:MAG TPA: Zn-dependent alcohol dehydrogenase [Acidimicrobiales bacterium]|nr:Zn-dependent alcohol dehydrogenase [Acidimicrobiales bacterium]